MDIIDLLNIFTLFTICNLFVQRAIVSVDYIWLILISLFDQHHHHFNGYLLSDVFHHFLNTFLPLNSLNYRFLWSFKELLQKKKKTVDFLFFRFFTSYNWSPSCLHDNRFNSSAFNKVSFVDFYSFNNFSNSFIFCSFSVVFFS